VKVLFICTANACRSQMAEAWARHLFPADWTAASAGLITHPIHDRTRAIMAEAGVGMEGQVSKSIDTQNLDAFDLVVTLSDEAGRTAYREGRDRLRALVADLIEEFPG
jgi:arsenate reductase